jgi:predicted ester cyclase
MNDRRPGAYGADDDIVDYILGITFEIWEQGGVELIGQYYGRNVVVHTLEGVTEGPEAMIDGTRAVLRAFPDRLLLADDVIWSGNREEGFHSSHRIVSPMTNRGPTQYGPATGKHVKIMNIADCFVEGGVITREWLMRDNHALVSQLGFNARIAAEEAAARRDQRSRDWLASELARLQGQGLDTLRGGLTGAAAEFAAEVIAGLWTAGADRDVGERYAPYAILHRSPVSLFSGRAALLEHYAELRAAFDVTGLSVDHVASLARGPAQSDLAVRWTVAGRHVGPYLGLAATGKKALILGATHWRIIDRRIAVEWTVFDGLGVLSQLV